MKQNDDQILINRLKESKKANEFTTMLIRNSQKNLDKILINIDKDITTHAEMLDNKFERMEKIEKSLGKQCLAAFYIILLIIIFIFYLYVVMQRRNVATTA